MSPRKSHYPRRSRSNGTQKIITERVFGWYGMGTLFNKAIVSFDLNLLMGVILFLSTLAILANLIADLLYSVLDPRIRVGAGK